MHEYDLIADWYAADRTHVRGLPEVQAFVAALPPRASVLDVGCGNGVPLTKFLVDAGFNIMGIDSSSRMLEKFRANLPNTPVMCSTIQAVELPNNAFDAAILWGMIFHLNHGDQSMAFAKVAAALKAGGRFLFTSGDRGSKEDDGIEGAPMNGVPFHYWSLGADGYREALSQVGLRLVETSQDPRHSDTYYLAEKV